MLEALSGVLEEFNYEEVSDVDFYTSLFKIGTGCLQKENIDKNDFKTNPIGIGINKDKTIKRVMFDDTFFESLKDLQKCDFSILSGLTYFGKKNTLNNASKCYALIFDIDYVGPSRLYNYIYGINNGVYPKPSFISLSGWGIHSYFVFDKPTDLYPGTKMALKELKYQLTDLMWNKHTSHEENKQFQGINQGFRTVGSLTKDKKGCVRAFKSPEDNTKITVEYLNSFLSEKRKVDFSKLYKESKTTIEEAKELYPEWYERIVVNKEPKNTWVTHKGLYEWWFEKIQNEATYGHRYYAVMALAIYAIKSGVSFEKLENDALSTLSIMNNINPEPFTEEDVKSALECYDYKYKTFPRSDIEKITAISITKNKRNGRSQKEHLKRARAVQDIDYPDGEWRDGNGRPNKEKIVKDYIKENPNATVTEISKALNISRPTVYKYQ
ncbi:MAG: hypothetical protein ACK5G7_06250 [Erysipelotrichaceae bacterium]